MNGENLGTAGNPHNGMIPVYMGMDSGAAVPVAPPTMLPNVKVGALARAPASPDIPVPASIN